MTKFLFFLVSHQLTMLTFALLIVRIDIKPIDINKEKIPSPQLENPERKLNKIKSDKI